MGSERREKERGGKRRRKEEERGEGKRRKEKERGRSEEEWKVVYSG